MGSERSEVLQGTLDLKVLKRLHALDPQYGFGIAPLIELVSIELVSEDVLTLNEGTVYTSLVAITAARLDRGRMGYFREQPSGDVLLDREWNQATCRRNRELGAQFRVIGRVLRLDGDK